MIGSTHAKPPQPNQAQQLVTRGYRGQLRRNYLIQLVDDDEAMRHAYSPQAGPAAKDAFFQARHDNWVNHGVLPVAVLHKLLGCWIAGKQLAAWPAPDASFRVDVGITFGGFLRMGAHVQLTDVFRRKAPAFAEGAYRRAARQLGDAGASAPLQWEERYRNDSIHVVLVLHTAPADSPAAVLAFESAVLAQLGCPAVASPAVLARGWIECSQALDTPGEIHFSMVDGLSMPRYHGIHPQGQLEAEAPANRHQPGELLLGHEKNDGSNPWLVPGANVQAGRPASISPLSAQKVYGDFFKDGTFGALRRMRQNVPAFENYIAAQAADHHGMHDQAYYAAWLKAKMLGRWANGEVVSETIDPSSEGALNDRQKARIRPVPSQSSTDNNFVYQNDRSGLQCPFGAHIRRMNPRDDPVVPRLRRPLLRRGVPYGDKYVKGSSESADRGLLGLFFCASLEEQFEHLLGNWANNNPMGMPFPEAGKDPLIGNHVASGNKDVGNRFEIPQNGQAALFLDELQVFVETRGTCYAFFPSISAMQKIAGGAITSATQFLKAP